MKDLIHGFIAFTVIATAAALAAVSTPPELKPQPGRPVQQASAQNEPNPTSVTVISPVKVDPNRDLFDYIATAIALGLLFFTGKQFWTLRESNKETKAHNTNTIAQMKAQTAANVTSNELTEESLRYTREVLEQPYMSLQRIKMENYEIGKTPAFQLEFVNAGRTPARDVMVQVAIETDGIIVEGGFRILKGNPVVRNSVTMGPYAVAANQPLFIHRAFDVDLSREVYDQFENGQVAILIRGRFAYGGVPNIITVDESFYMIYTPWKDRPEGFEKFEHCIVRIPTGAGQTGNTQ